MEISPVVMPDVARPASTLSKEVFPAPVTPFVAVEILVSSCLFGC